MAASSDSRLIDNPTALYMKPWYPWLLVIGGIVLATARLLLFFGSDAAARMREQFNQVMIVNLIEISVWLLLATFLIISGLRMMNRKLLYVDGDYLFVRNQRGGFCRMQRSTVKSKLIRSGVTLLSDGSKKVRVFHYQVDGEITSLFSKQGNKS